jgi:hypothetical protein
MKRWFIAVLGAVLLLVLVAGCGETATTTSTARAGGDLETYRAEMQTWLNKYETDLTTAANALDSIEDPTNASAEQIEAVKGFAGLMEDVVKDLKDIKPTPGLSSAHADFLASLESMAEGLDQIAGALENKSMPDFMSAFATIAATSEKGTAGQATLEEALGFSLSDEEPGQGTTDSSTVGGGPGGTREKPLPLGQEAQIGDWKVKVVSANLNATSQITSDDWSDPPQAGNQYVLVDLEATYTGSESASFWADMSYNFVGSGGNTFGAPEGFASSPHPISDAGEAFAGASITGDVLFEVASDQVAGGVLMIEEFTFEGARVFFAVK